MKPTILKKIVNSLNLNRYYKDEFYKFLLGNGSGSNSEKIVCTIDYDFSGKITIDTINQYFNNLSFINHNPLEPIELQLKVRQEYNRDDWYILMNCVSCAITQGNADDETPIKIQNYYFFNEGVDKYCISIAYRESDNSFYDAYIDNEQFNEKEQ